MSLVLDSRDQLAALVPASTPEGQALMAGIKEKLDTVSQPFCSEILKYFALK